MMAGEAESPGNGFVAEGTADGNGRDERAIAPTIALQRAAICSMSSKYYGDDGSAGRPLADILFVGLTELEGKFWPMIFFNGANSNVTWRTTYRKWLPSVSQDRYYKVS